MNEGTLLNGRYQLLEKLGSGGMAEVFRARDSVLDRIVAIKVLRKDYSSNPDFQEHFRTEARAAANLSHPNIVTVHDFGFADNLLFIVMEHIPGKDLKQLPIDTLKIDKTFVGDLTTDPDDEAIVSTVIMMAHSLGLDVIAEGVETDDQLRYLAEQKCDEVQGNLISSPLDADHILQFLLDRRAEAECRIRARFAATSSD